MGEVPRSSRAPWWIAILLCAIPLCAAAQAPQKPAASADKVLWAKLQARFDSAKVKVGDPVPAQVLRDWSAQSCMVPSGSSLLGKVAGFSPWSASSKSIEVSLAFTARCLDGQIVPIKLIAVLYPVEDEKSQMDVSTAMPSGIGAGASGRRSTNLDALPTPGNGRPDLPASVRVGQVTGIRHVSLSLATAVNQTAVLSSTDQRLRLDPGTRLAFHGSTDSQ